MALKRFHCNGTENSLKGSTVNGTKTKGFPVNGAKTSSKGSKVTGTKNSSKSSTVMTLKIVQKVQ